MDLSVVPCGSRGDERRCGRYDDFHSHQSLASLPRLSLLQRYAPTPSSISLYSTDKPRTGGLADPLVRQLVSLQASTNEYLRLFWSAVLPPKAGDTSAMALATPTMKAAKAERMIGYLGAQEEKMVALVQRSRRAETEGEIADRIEAVSTVGSRR